LLAACRSSLAPQLGALNLDAVGVQTAGAHRHCRSISDKGKREIASEIINAAE
jgi:hypothetical protein